jgi:hypothetical protein
VWRFAWLVVVPACTIAFGLDEPRDDDRDHDGIPDSRDNCPTVANVDQSDHDGNGIGDACDGCNSVGGPDSDGDGIPDACDGCDNTQPDLNGDGVPDVCEHPSDPCPGCAPCAIGPLHDEDHDMISDGCDLCPANPKPTGDADHDGVGDACDVLSSNDPNQQLFDAFLIPNESWFVHGDWAWTADSITHQATGDDFRQLGTAARGFVVSTHVVAPPVVTTQVTFGVYASVDTQSPMTSGDSIGCSFQVGTTGATAAFGASQSNFAIGVSGNGLLPASGYTFTMIYIGTAASCTVVDDQGESLFDTGPVELMGSSTGLWLPGITAGGMGVRFDYYDVIGDQH